MRRLLPLVVVLVAACGGDDDERLTVYAASSLTDVLERIDPDARFNFAGSDELATQLREGAGADVYAAASPRYPQQLYSAGVVERPRTFATNRLVLIVPRRNDARLATLSDLERPGVRLVIGARGVPIGDYTRRLLANARATAVLRRVVSEEEDVKGVVGKVALGEADAGFVYATDVTAVAGDVRALELPRSAQTPIEYQVALVRTSARTAAARRFVARLFSREARAALRAAGFGVP